MYYKMVILFDTFSILSPAAILENCLENSWTKILQYLVCQLKVFFICSLGIFSDRETLELLADSI